MYSGVVACLRAVASAAMVWLWGPPWRPGNTEKLIGSSKLYGVPSALAPLR